MDGCARRRVLRRMTSAHRFTGGTTLPKSQVPAPGRAPSTFRVITSDEDKGWCRANLPAFDRGTFCNAEFVLRSVFRQEPMKTSLDVDQVPFCFPCTPASLLRGSARVPGNFFFDHSPPVTAPPPLHQTIHKLSGPLSWGYRLINPQNFSGPLSWGCGLQTKIWQ